MQKNTKRQIMREILLADRYDTIDIIKEAKGEWVINLLLMLGVNKEELETGSLDSIHRHMIEVWDDLATGDVEILQNEVLVGKWYAPTLVPKTDEKNVVYY